MYIVCTRQAIMIILLSISSQFCQSSVMYVYFHTAHDEHMQCK